MMHRCNLCGFRHSGDGVTCERCIEGIHTKRVGEHDLVVEIPRQTKVDIWVAARKEVIAEIRKWAMDNSEYVGGPDYIHIAGFVVRRNLLLAKLDELEKS